MDTNGQLIRKYRPSVPFAVGLAVAIGFPLLGIAMAVPTSTSDVAGNIIGGFVILAAFWGGGISWTNGVSLTPEGIVKRQTFRRTSIPWDMVESFTVAPVPRRQSWRTIKVELRPTGYSYLTPLAGREQYIQRVIGEFEEYRAALG
jgi:hypothetical protein